MIIDSHLHFGKCGYFDLPFELIKRQMKLNKITGGIISPVTGAEFDAENGKPFENAMSQIEANGELLSLLKTESELSLYMSFWCKPATESNHIEVYNFIKDNRKHVVGLKFHPFYSQLPLEDERYSDYIEIAKALNLPISVHTAADNLSSAPQLLRLAKKHPDVDFIMVHLELMSDNETAIECVSKADNLYGDTSWVPLEKIMKAIAVCGSEKILFGSDAPIDKEKSYDFYNALLTSSRISNINNVLYNNSKRLFKL